MKLQLLLSLACVGGAVDSVTLNSMEKLYGHIVEEQNSGLGMISSDVQKTSVSSVEEWVVDYRRSAGHVQKALSNVDKRSANYVQKSSARETRSSAHGKERVIKRQINQLEKMKCKPRRTKMNVAALLEETNEQKFKLLFPQVIAVRRCIASCSYCGDSHGLESKKCVSTHHTMKRFTIRYYGDLGKRQYFKTPPIRVDKKCQCQ